MVKQEINSSNETNVANSSFSKTHRYTSKVVKRERECSCVTSTTLCVRTRTPAMSDDACGGVTLCMVWCSPCDPRWTTVGRAAAAAAPHGHPVSFVCRLVIHPSHHLAMRLTGIVPGHTVARGFALCFKSATGSATVEGGTRFKVAASKGVCVPFLMLLLLYCSVVYCPAFLADKH